MCFDGEKRLAHIRGKMRKKVSLTALGPCSFRILTTFLCQVWINQGDIILLSLRDFQDGKADVIVKYSADEARSCASPPSRPIPMILMCLIPVKAYGELPENAKINETDTFGDEEGEVGFEFAEGGDDLDIEDI